MDGFPYCSGPGAKVRWVLGSDFNQEWDIPILGHSRGYKDYVESRGVSLSGEACTTTSKGILV